MSELKVIALECAGCTAPLSEAIVAKGVHKCPYCGYVNILPKSEQSSEVLHCLRTGDIELKNGDFERAYNAYSEAVRLDPQESKGYFGMALATNKVKYVRDVVNNRWQAICCQITEKRFIDDSNFRRAGQCATLEQREEYISRAREIDYIREKFVELKKSGLEYDTFLCVKVSDGKGGFTTDSHWAGKLYDNLKKLGIKPFYSEREIGERTGEDYEALILYALHTSKSMVVICSDEDYLRTPWVQNEYSRYYSMMSQNDKLKNSIMIAFSGTVIENLPGIPGKMQGVDLGSFDASQKINEFVSKFANAEERARKEAEEKAKKEAERIAEKEAEKKAREEQQKILEELQKQLEETRDSVKNKKKEDDEDSERKYCAKCGAKNKIDVRFCYLCGHGEFLAKDEKFCTNCKQMNSISTKRCTGCGSGSFVNSLEECERIYESRKENERKRKEIEEEKRKQEQILELKEKKKQRRKRFIKIAIPVTIILIALAIFAFLKSFDEHSSDMFKLAIKNNEATITEYIGGDVYVEIPGEIDGYTITKIGAGAFADCSQIISVSVPASVKKIGAFAFYNCSALTDVTIAEGTEQIGMFSFYGCKGMVELTVPSSVKKIKMCAFTGCNKLVEVLNLSNIDASKKFPHIKNIRTSAEENSIIGTSGDFIFMKEGSVITTDIFGNTTSDDSNASVYLMGYTSTNPIVTLPATYDGLSYKIYDYAFYKRHDIVSLSIPSTVMGVGEQAFYGCYKLVEIFDNPDNKVYVTEGSNLQGYVGYYAEAVHTSMSDSSYVKRVGDFLFLRDGSSTYLIAYTGSADTVVLPESYNGDTYKIYEYAFYRRNDIKEVCIPQNVTYIGEKAFAKCDSLKTIRLEITYEPSSWSSFWDSKCKAEILFGESW